MGKIWERFLRYVTPSSGWKVKREMKFFSKKRAGGL